MPDLKTKGFSLVELAIVLVIIGLITGGILTGQDLIRASELNSVAADINKYKTAVNTFKLKYNGLPGDLNNAASYWAATTNGNNDGTISPNSTTTTAFESYRAWQQLSLSGLIAGNYSGTATVVATNFGVSVVETNVPALRFGAKSGLQFTAYSTPNLRFMVATESSGYMLEGYIFKPDEAASLDTKVDDGLPTTGKWQGFHWTGGTCTTGTAYQLTSTATTCVMYVYF